MCLCVRVCVLALRTAPLPLRVSHSLVKWLFEWFFNEVLSGGSKLPGCSVALLSLCVCAPLELAVAACVCVCVYLVVAAYVFVSFRAPLQIGLRSVHTFS